MKYFLFFVKPFIFYWFVIVLQFIMLTQKLLKICRKMKLTHFQNLLFVILITNKDYEKILYIQKE